MRDFIEECFIPMVFMVLVVIALVVVITLPIMWFDGHAKSRWIKQTKNIDIVWYEATFIDLSVTDNKLDIK
jgi:steroid 5-alpha reductase family enzyme